MVEVKRRKKKGKTGYKKEEKEENSVFRGGCRKKWSAQSGSPEKPFGGRVRGKRGFPGWLP
jgi:hypothetical protein